MTRALVLPSHDDPVVAGAVEAVGGPPGRHARLGERRLWTPTRVLIALTLLTSLLGFAQKAPCRDGSTWVHEHQYTKACYTDVVALYSSEGLAKGDLPYYDHPVEYPVVIGAVMEISSLMTRAVTAAFPDDKTGAAQRAFDKSPTPANRNTRDYAAAIARGRHFYDLTWALVTICALVVTVTTARLSGRRPWDAAMFALVGVVAMTGYVCVNRGLQLAQASIVAPFGYLSIVWASMLGFVIFHEIPEPNTLAGAALIVGAGLFILVRERRLTPGPTAAQAVTSLGGEP